MMPLTLLSSMIVKPWYYTVALFHETERNRAIVVVKCVKGRI